MPIEERPCLIDKGRIKLRSLGIFRLVPGRQFSRRFNKPSLCYHAAVQLSWSTFSNCKYAPNISYVYCGAIHKYFAGVHVPNAPRFFPHFNESKHGKRIILGEINQWQSYIRTWYNLYTNNLKSIAIDNAYVCMYVCIFGTYSNSFFYLQLQFSSQKLEQ
jgi:hypothetical protein